MDYRKYKLEDFATDNLFVRWVLENDREATEFWQAYLEANPDVKPVAEQARILLLNLSRTHYPMHTPGQVDRIWTGIDARTTPSIGAKYTFSFRSLMKIAAAAFVLVSVGTVVWFYSLPENTTTAHVVTEPQPIATRHVVTSGDRKQSLHLEDGTVVTLEPKSSLSYAESFRTDSVREVFLEGEAFFAVARNPERPFLVHANEVVTKVLGTSFRVKAFAEARNVLVAVTEGKVSVYSTRESSAPDHVNKEVKGVVLTSNQQVLYSRSEDAFSRSLVEAPSLVPQYDQRNKLSFNNAAMDEVFGALEEAYGVEIIFPGDVMENCFLTVSLLDEPLYEKLSIVCKTIGATYELIDGKIIIDSKGCR